MFATNVSRQLIAAIGAILMSTITVGAAVAPAAVASPVVSAHA